MDGHGTVIEPALKPQRRAEHTDGGQAQAGLGQAPDLLFDGIEQRLLQQQVVDGVGAEAQLRKQQDRRALIMALLHQGQGLIGVEHHIGGPNRRHADA